MSEKTTAYLVGYSAGEDNHLITEEATHYFMGRSILAGMHPLIICSSDPESEKIGDALYKAFQKHPKIVDKEIIYNAPMLPDDELFKSISIAGLVEGRRLKKYARSTALHDTLPILLTRDKQVGHLVANTMQQYASWLYGATPTPLQGVTPYTLLNQSTPADSSEAGRVGISMMPSSTLAREIESRPRDTQDAPERAAALEHLPESVSV